jgi:hypothetical protein
MVLSSWVVFDDRIDCLTFVLDDERRRRTRRRLQICCWRVRRWPVLRGVERIGRRTTRDCGRCCHRAAVDASDMDREREKEEKTTKR